LKRALTEFNIPKIVTDDQPIFLNLIADLFPKVEFKVKDNPDFKNQVKSTATKDMGLQADDIFVKKVV